jgi:alpha-tubulin suppressor-like RCC1 family protein
LYKFAAGKYFSMAIVQDSKCQQTLWVIGNNEYGQLGLGNTTNRTTWQNTGLKCVTLVACGYNHSICVSEGYLWVTGDNSRGQLGLDYTGGKVKKWTKTIYGNIQRISCGRYHNLFISNGTLYVAGDNSRGQLGFDPLYYPWIYPWTKMFSDNLTEIACGAYHSLCIGGINKNHFYIAGDNTYGQLGSGYSSSRPVYPWLLDCSENSLSLTYLNIACGDYHSIFVAYGPLESNPNIVSKWIYVAGDNRFGQLGLPSYFSKKDYWTQLPYGNIDNIACGANHSMFTSGGNLWVTGRNSKGQLGIGSTTDSYGWQQTIYGNLQYNIAGGTEHNLFISQNNTWGAGDNAYMELGVKDFKDQYSVWFIIN